MSKIINTNTCIRRQDVNKVNSKSMSVTFFTCRYYYILTDFLHCLVHILLTLNMLLFKRICAKTYLLFMCFDATSSCYMKIKKCFFGKKTS